MSDLPLQRFGERYSRKTLRVTITARLAVTPPEIFRLSRDFERFLKQRCL